MTVSFDIYTAVRDYLDGRLSLEQLRAVISPHLDQILADRSTDLYRIVDLVWSYSAEIAAGIEIEEGARDELRGRLLPLVPFVAYPEEHNAHVVLESGSSFWSNLPIPQQITSSSSGDTAPRAVHA
jgi:hypothetical protein